VKWPILTRLRGMDKEAIANKHRAVPASESVR
jgi:hypothetical protein